jgi:serine protease Do
LAHALVSCLARLTAALPVRAGWLRPWVLPLVLGSALPAGAETALEARSRALTRASAAVVGLSATAVEDARSASTLGRERAGSGVVISSDGLVLTIGYLVLEAESVALTTDDGRRFPARVVAYDLATGFGLVQALAPLGLQPVPLGDPAGTRADDDLVVASGGDDGAITAARLLSRRAFSGYWEYHVEGALFTAPPRRDHSGAALFNPQGELLGIGSLFVPDAQEGPAPRQPGNMFVPVDLLKPVLAELRQRGSSSASARPWLGLNCIAQDGEVLVMRVSEDSPADVAGLQRGDRIVRIDGIAVADLALLWKTLWAGAGAERAVTLDILRDGQAQTLTVQAVDRAKTLKRAQGI